MELEDNAKANGRSAARLDGFCEGEVSLGGLGLGILIIHKDRVR